MSEHEAYKAAWAFMRARDESAKTHPSLGIKASYPSLVPPYTVDWAQSGVTYRTTFRPAASVPGGVMWSTTWNGGRHEGPGSNEAHE